MSDITTNNTHTQLQTAPVRSCVQLCLEIPSLENMGKCVQYFVMPWFIIQKRSMMVAADNICAVNEYREVAGPLPRLSSVKLSCYWPPEKNRRSLGFNASSPQFLHWVNVTLVRFKSSVQLFWQSGEGMTIFGPLVLTSNQQDLASLLDFWSRSKFSISRTQSQMLTPALVRW